MPDAHGKHLLKLSEFNSWEDRSVRTIMIHAVIDDRLRRVWAILIGMSAVAATVGLITIAIHERAL